MRYQSLPAAIRSIEELINVMASLVEDQIARALSAAGTVQESRAEIVSLRDEDVDALRDAIQEFVRQTLEQWAPIGPALRQLMTYHLIADELERLGDYAAHIARDFQGLRLHVPLALLGLIEEMAQVTRQHVRTGLQALADRDTLEIQLLESRDADLDRMRKRIFVALQEFMQLHPDAIHLTIPFLFAVRDLERIGDRIVNIGEDVVYARTGEHIKVH